MVAERMAPVPMTRPCPRDEAILYATSPSDRHGIPTGLIDNAPPLRACCATFLNKPVRLA